MNNENKRLDILGLDDTLLERVSAGGKELVKVSNSVYNIMIYDDGAYCTIVEPVGMGYKDKIDWKFKNDNKIIEKVFMVLTQGEKMGIIKAAIEKEGAIIE